MNLKNLFEVRVTGILIENDELLIVRQTLSENRKWSLPGGRLERGETIEECIKREILEETGLNVCIDILLYLCDRAEDKLDLIHITFLLKKISGHITLPTNEFDENPIYDVKMVKINELEKYGFSNKFIDLINDGFPDSGSYKGYKKNIGLGI